MKTNQVCTCFCKIGNQAIYRFHHEVHINHRWLAIFCSMWANCLANQGANSQVGDVVVVHHIKVNPVCTRHENILNFLAQAGKVGRQNGGGNDKLAI